MSHVHIAVFLFPTNNGLRYVLPDGVICSPMGACGNTKYARPGVYLHLRNWCVVPIGDRV